MSGANRVKWFVAGAVALVVGVLWFRAASRYEEPVHITPREAHKAADALKGLEKELGSRAVAPLPGREPMPVEDGPPAPAQARAAESGSGTRIIVDNQLPDLNTTNWITGRVILKGNPPAPRPLEMSENCAELARKHFPGQVMMTRDFRVGTNGGLADVIVSLDDIADEMAGMDLKPVELTIRGCQLHPVVLACVAGQPIHVRNRDAEFHDLRANPTVVPNSPLEYMLFPNGPETVVVYQGIEENIRVTIDEKPWAEAFITVLSHPYFAVTDTNGLFRIPLPPKGRYKVRAAHRKLEPRTGMATVSPGRDATIDFELEYRK